MCYPGPTLHLQRAAQKSKAFNTEAKEEKKSKEKLKKGSKAEFIRLDHVWSQENHRYLTQTSSEDKDAGQYDGYAFNITRYFDWKNRHTHTRLNMLSQYLKKALFNVMGKVSGISLKETTPSIDPNMAFLYLEELRVYMKDIKRKYKEIKKSKSKKGKKKAEDFKLTQEHLNVLVNYLNKDYEKTKKSLGPLLDSGKITFDLVWALFKSNEVVYTNTYEHEDQPRAAKVSFIHKVRIKSYLTLSQRIHGTVGNEYHARGILSCRNTVLRQ